MPDCLLISRDDSDFAGTLLVLCTTAAPNVETGDGFQPKHHHHHLLSGPSRAHQRRAGRPSRPGPARRDRQLGRKGCDSESQMVCLCLGGGCWAVGAWRQMVAQWEDYGTIQTPRRPPAATNIAVHDHEFPFEGEPPPRRPSAPCHGGTANGPCSRAPMPVPVPVPVHGPPLPRIPPYIA